jgi:hypothetical protein
MTRHLSEGQSPRSNYMTTQSACERRRNSNLRKEKRRTPAPVTFLQSGRDTFEFYKCLDLRLTGFLEGLRSLV